MALADHAYLLETGRMVLHGTSAELSANEDIQRAYLGYAASDDAAPKPAARV